MTNVTNISLLFRSIALSAAIVCLLMNTPTASAEPALVTPGKLTYGVNATFAPFEFQQGDALVGLDIDIGAELGKRMNLQVEPMNMEFQGLIPALFGGRIDLINSAMYINPERSAQVDFIPYLRLGNELVVLKGNPKKISGRNETMCGTTVAVTLGSVQEKYAKADDERCKASGKDGIVISTYPTNQVTALTLRQGKDRFFSGDVGERTKRFLDHILH